jgi:hypothetical protein
MIEIAYIGGRNKVEIPHRKQMVKFENRKPRFVPDDLAMKLVRQDNFVLAEDLVRTLEELMPEGGLVLARRWGAVGDLIMLRAAISAFTRHNGAFRFILKCHDRYAPLFKRDRLWVRPKEQPDPILGTPPLEEKASPFSFDQIAEQDHRGVQESRVDLFLRAMTNAKLDVRREDWDIPTSEAAKKYVAGWLEKRGLGPGRARKLVALQVRGSGKMKSLPREQVQAIAKALTEHADVVLIEPNVSETFAGDGIHSMPGRDAMHSVELLRHVDLCICYDSGVLWMAHVAAAPVLCIMGPTRPEQRLTYHPLYPDKVRAVLLNQVVELKGKVGCAPCFEAAEACQKSYACMQKQPQERVVTMVLERAVELLGAPLPVLT